MTNTTNEQLFLAITNPLLNLCPLPWIINTTEDFRWPFIKNGNGKFVVTVEDGVDIDELINRVEDSRGKGISDTLLNVALKMLMMEVRSRGLKLDPDGWKYDGNRV